MKKDNFLSHKNCKTVLILTETEHNQLKVCVKKKLMRYVVLKKYMIFSLIHISGVYPVTHRQRFKHKFNA